MQNTAEGLDQRADLGCLGPTALHPIFFYQRQTLAETVSRPSSGEALFQTD